MPSLSEVTATTRTFLKWAGIVFVVFLLIRFLIFPTAKLLFTTLFPKKPEAPTVAFGKLPKIPFPRKEPLKLTFKIQTTTGALPQTPRDVPDRLNVYPVVKRQAGFLSLDQAKQKVANIGFREEAIALSPTTYQWTDKLGRKIIFDIVTEEFHLTTKISTEEAMLDRPPPSKSAAITLAKSFFSRLSLLPNDLDEAKTKTTFLKTLDGKVVEATSLSESDFIQVDFYRKPISDLPIVHPNPKQSLISVRIKPSEQPDRQIEEAHYSYKKVDTTSSSTYPIKTAQEAFEELSEGQGFIALAKDRDVAIEKVYTAYYENNDDLEFFLPVFVFEGKDFLGFVSAVKAEWQE